MEAILVTVSGPDRPGITANLMKCLVKGHHRLRDMGQSVTHGLLSLSLLIEVHSNTQHDPLVTTTDSVIKDLLFEAKKMGLSLDFKLIQEELSDTSSASAFKEKSILTCVAAEEIRPEFLFEVTSLLAAKQVNILRIDNKVPSGLKSLEMTTLPCAPLDWTHLKEDLLRISHDHQVDIAFIKENIFRRPKRLVVFDMDSTLIQTEVIDAMAEAHGVGDRVKEITDLAMNGKLDFTESLQERVKLLKGLPYSKLEDIHRSLELNPGVEAFVHTVKKAGYRLAIISGGFNYFASRFKDRLGFDYAFANDLDVEDGRLTGKLRGPIINAEKKALLLEMLAQQEKIDLEQVVAIGDGANDLPMLSKAGLGIAYHAKDVVKRKASQHMSHGPMTSILTFLGLSEGL